MDITLLNLGTVNKNRVTLKTAKTAFWIALASSLGYVPCECGVTDGTVDCEHKTASQMMQAAADYLDTHLGEEFDGADYFDGS